MPSETGATRGAGAPTGLSVVAFSGRLLALGLGLLAVGVFLLTSRGVGVADNLVHADMAIGLVSRGSPALSFDPANPALAVRRPGGQMVSSLGPGLPLVAAPLVAIGAGARWLTAPKGPDGLPAAIQGTMGVAPRRALVKRFHRINEDPRIVAFSLVNPLLGGATVLLVVWLALALGLSTKAATLAGALLGLGSPLLVYAGSGWTQPLVTFALTATAASLVAFHRSGGRGAALGAGAGLGLAVLTRLDALWYGIPLGALFGLALWKARGSIRALLALTLFAMPVVLALLGWLLWNLWRFGHPVGPGAAWQASRWQPEAVARGVLGLLASPQEGLLFFAPFTILVPWGALYLRRATRRSTTSPPAAMGTNEPALIDTYPPAAIDTYPPALIDTYPPAAPDERSHAALAVLAPAAFAVLALQVLLYGAWWDWGSNLSYGPRYLVPSLPLLVLVVAVLADRAGRAGRLAVGTALGLGLLGQIPGALLGPLKLPEVAEWTELSFGVGYLALFGGHFVVPGSGSVWGDVVDCRSGASQTIAALGLLAIALGAALLWKHRASSRSRV